MLIPVAEVSVAEGSASALIECGWVIAGELEPQVLAAVRAARDRFVERMQRELPEFEWRCPLVVRPRLVQTPVVQPAVLLEAAASERDARRWDFALLVTDAELVSYYTPYTVGTPARALGAAVISTAHLEPADDGSGRDPVETMTVRLEREVLHLLGHLNGLGHGEGHVECAMAPVHVGSDLDKPRGLTDEERTRLCSALREVADLRLEERPGAHLQPFTFYLRALWHNRGDIWSAVRQLAPWRFPLRFSKLTIAAMSTLLILSVTAESWQLGMSQPGPRVIAFALLAIAGSSTFVIKRQRLLTRSSGARRPAQTAVSNLSMVIGVVVGMLTTYLVIFLFVFAFAHLLFSPQIAGEWAGFEGTPQLGRYVIFAGFVSTLALIAGALGASFEAESYFRHVAYVDDET